ncbi:MAG TPA: hypothetical protein DEG88_00120 [Propionibacteriaceae bacterium]|uniref:Uncharacterized protein n=1 Tax=Candidatus Phosphoribacter hodrii TaxID=2953743 RepID=A0A934X8M8_9MICO|nr:hypothetical protein [Candidatus Phosphoribacter hodrii]HBY21743.1 hypothetical protein [Propionibacteriaceae bacterium]
MSLLRPFGPISAGRAMLMGFTGALFCVAMVIMTAGGIWMHAHASTLQASPAQALESQHGSLTTDAGVVVVMNKPVTAGSTVCFADDINKNVPTQLSCEFPWVSLAVPPLAYLFANAIFQMNRLMAEVPFRRRNFLFLL